MIVSLTGTPGVGKSSVAKILKKRYNVIDLVELAMEKGFLLGYDESRGSYIIDIDRLKDNLRREIKGEKVYILDGHISHLVEFSDMVIVLRCRPDLLRERLTRKGWKEEKIKENVDAEILDVILVEAVDIHGTRNVLEIDTSDKSIEQIAETVEGLIEGRIDQEIYRVGNIDWTSYVE